ESVVLNFGQVDTWYYYDDKTEEPATQYELTSLNMNLADGIPSSGTWTAWWSLTGMDDEDPWISFDLDGKYSFEYDKHSPSKGTGTVTWVWTCAEQHDSCGDVGDVYKEGTRTNATLDEWFH
ncbi:MAG: hypothetical protein HN348_28895, partial [Proteobacteria bacterium]|nr:hypothetical protein [Pseudomonadota bacterium]